MEKKTTDGIVQREKEHGDTFFFPTSQGIHNVSFLPVVYLLHLELEWKISESGAIKTDLEENPRKQIQDQMMTSIKCSVPTKRDENDSEED